MGKAVLALGAAIAVVFGAFVLAPAVVTQEPAPTPAPRVEPRMSWLAGRGAAIGVRVRDAESGGALIDDVDEDGPAGKAGVRDGDVVVEFDGERVRSARQFSRLVQETPEGRTVTATLVRDGSRRTVEITPAADWRVGHGGDVVLALPEIERHVERGLEALPRHFSFDFDWDGSPMIAMGRGRLGARLQSLTDQLAEYFGAKTGVLVSSVEADSAAAKAGLKAGDVITAINGRSVREPRDVTQEVRGAEPGTDVEIAVLRDRKALTLKAQVPERPSASRRVTRPA